MIKYIHFGAKLKYYNRGKKMNDQLKNEMIRLLKENYDYISKYDALQFLKNIYRYTQGWIPIAIQAYDEAYIDEF